MIPKCWKVSHIFQKHFHRNDIWKQNFDPCSSLTHVNVIHDKCLNLQPKNLPPFRCGNYVQNNPRIQKNQILCESMKMGNFYDTPKLKLTCKTSHETKLESMRYQISALSFAISAQQPKRTKASALDSASPESKTVFTLRRSSNRFSGVHFNRIPQCFSLLFLRLLSRDKKTFTTQS